MVRCKRVLFVCANTVGTDNLLLLIIKWPSVSQPYRSKHDHHLAAMLQLAFFYADGENNGHIKGTKALCITLFVSIRNSIKLDLPMIPNFPELSRSS